MKKLITIIALCICFSAFAQPEKGKFLLSGNISFGRGEGGTPLSVISGTKKDQFSASPYVGYFVSPKIAIGVAADYTSYKSEFAGILQGKYKSVNAGPFFRYYHSITDKFFFFGQVDLMFGGYTSDYQQFDPVTGTVIAMQEKISATTFSVRPGISYFIAKRWAVELLFGYLSYSAAENKGNYKPNPDPGGFSGGIITRGVAPGIVFTF